jgi:N-methylhydantoinase B
MRVYDAILGCLNQALPGGLAAAGSGQAGIISVASVDERTGRRHVSVVEPFIGGSGGRCKADGIDGIDQPVAFLRSAPVEVVETETQLLIRCFRFEPGSAAPGLHRGGYGMCIELENRGLTSIVTVRGLDRFRFQPWGVAGGACGRAAVTVLNPDTAEARDIGKIDVLELRRGEVLRMITPSGGGFGDPLLRDPALVLDEVTDGMLSSAQALSQYGVVIASGAVDAVATAVLRSRPRERAPAFSLGPVRLALEAKWPNAASAALATAALRAPDGVRTFALAAIRADVAVPDGVAAVGAVDAAASRYFGCKSAP